jgi:hypothetical protein
MTTHHDVGLASADLQADVAAFNLDDRRGAPSGTTCDPAGHDAFAVLGAHDESRALQVGDHTDALGLLQQVGRNRVIFGVENLGQDIRRFDHALLSVVFGVKKGSN